MLQFLYYIRLFFLITVITCCKFLSHKSIVLVTKIPLLKIPKNVELKKTSNAVNVSFLGKFPLLFDEDARDELGGGGGTLDHPVVHAGGGGLDLTEHVHRGLGGSLGLCICRRTHPCECVIDMLKDRTPPTKYNIIGILKLYRRKVFLGRKTANLVV